MNLKLIAITAIVALVDLVAAAPVRVFRTLAAPVTQVVSDGEGVGLLDTRDGSISELRGSLDNQSSQLSWFLPDSHPENWSSQRGDDPDSPGGQKDPSLDRGGRHVPTATIVPDDRCLSGRRPDHLRELWRRGGSAFDRRHQDGGCVRGRVEDADPRPPAGLTQEAPEDSIACFASSPSSRPLSFETC